MKKNSFISLWLLVFGFSLMAEDLGVTGLLLMPGKPCPISSVFAGSPADRAGIKAGWFLISIDGTNVVDMPLPRTGGMLRGPVGKRVTLELADSAMSRTNKFTLRRAKMVLGKTRVEFSNK
jgi:carboxyl-terminal processing protease